MPEFVDARTLIPIERLLARVGDLSPIPIDVEDEHSQLDVADVLELAASGDAFPVYAENLLTGRVTAFAPGQLWSCLFHVRSARSVAAFGGAFDPFGGAWPDARLVDCVERFAAWRESHGLASEVGELVSVLAGLHDAPERDPILTPVFGVLVEGATLEEPEQAVRSEYESIARGRWGNHHFRRLDDHPDCMTSAEVARYLRVPEQTLRRWRTVGHGPPAVKLTDAAGGKVLYRKAAVESWLRERELGTD